MLNINHIHFSYHGEREILNDITLEIPDGESVGIVGANGVGKSTLLKLLVGIEYANSGKVEVEQIPVCKKNLTEVRKHIGYVFQDSDAQLFMPTVLEDVEFAPLNFGYSKEDARNLALQTLDSLNILHLRDKSIYHLSGGEKKLVSIATVLVMNPKTIIFDEPTVGLDPRNRKIFCDTLNRLTCTKIVASHDLDFILDTCKTCILISNGKIKAMDATKHILTNQKLLEDNGLLLPLSIHR